MTRPSAAAERQAIRPPEPGGPSAAALTAASEVHNPKVMVRAPATPEAVINEPRIKVVE